MGRIEREGLREPDWLITGTGTMVHRRTGAASWDEVGDQPWRQVWDAAVEAAVTDAMASAFPAFNLGPAHEQAPGRLVYFVDQVGQRSPSCGCLSVCLSFYLCLPACLSMFVCLSVCLPGSAYLHSRGARSSVLAPGFGLP